MCKKEKVDDNIFFEKTGLSRSKHAVLVAKKVKSPRSGSKSAVFEKAKKRRSKKNVKIDIRKNTKLDENKQMYTYGLTKKCYGLCKLMLPIENFGIRSKVSGQLEARCSICNCLPRYDYGLEKKCIGDCGETLPIEKFKYKSKKTGQREGRCSKCIYAGLDKDEVKERWRRWYYERGGREWVHIYNFEYKARRNKLHREKCRNDPVYKLKCNIRNRIYDRLRHCGIRETDKIEYLGMSGQCYKEWIESQFTVKMKWENYGTYWEIDHTKPIASFDLSNDNEIYECFDWKNTRPLKVKENMCKNDKVDYKIIKEHRYTVEAFLWIKFDETGDYGDNDRKSYYTERLYA